VIVHPLGDGGGRHCVATCRARGLGLLTHEVSPYEVWPLLAPAAMAQRHPPLTTRRLDRPVASQSAHAFVHSPPQTWAPLLPQSGVCGPTPRVHHGSCGSYRPRVEGEARAKTATALFTGRRCGWVN
jgi:hypothetical protein